MQKWLRSIYTVLKALYSQGQVNGLTIRALFELAQAQRFRDQRVEEALLRLAKAQEVTASAVLTLKESQQTTTQVVSKLADGFDGLQKTALHTDTLVGEILSALTVRPAVAFVITLCNLDGSNPQGENEMSVFQIKDDSPDLLLKLTPVDDQGFAAPVDGEATFQSDDESIATVTPQADGVSAVIHLLDKTPGKKVTINVTADADLGAGTDTITDSAELNFIAGEATHLGLSLTPIPADGGGNGGGGTDAMTIDPTSATVAPSGTQQFTASEPSTFSATSGSVDANGLYTAPADGSGATSDQVVATSVADPTKSATASVSLSTPATPAPAARRRS
jgi:hypothetical protein